MKRGPTPLQRIVGAMSLMSLELFSGTRRLSPRNMRLCGKKTISVSKLVIKYVHVSHVFSSQFWEQENATVEAKGLHVREGTWLRENFTCSSKGDEGHAHFRRSCFKTEWRLKCVKGSFSETIQISYF